MAEALSSAPDRMAAVLEDAQPGGSWRACAGLEEPSPELAEALGHLAEMVQAPDGQARASVKSVLAAIRDQPESSRHDRAGELWRLARAVLRPVLEWQHRPIGE
jgi:hypothetical protein